MWSSTSRHPRPFLAAKGILNVYPETPGFCWADGEGCCVQDVLAVRRGMTFATDC